MSNHEKMGYLHRFVGLIGSYMSLMVGEIIGFMSLITATANVLYACFLLLGSNVAD